MSGKVEKYDQLTTKQKRELLSVARKTVENVVTGQYPPKFEYLYPLWHENRGAFVTLHKHGELRGCIGYVQPIKSLLDTIVDMAEAAALRDPRFHPVDPEEVSDLDIEISVLSPLKLIESTEEIVVRTHGLVIEYGSRTGLLLPQVAAEQNWDRETFLENTCLKAGLALNTWMEKKCKIYIFSAEVFAEKDILT